MRVFKTKLIRLQLTAEELEALTADFISYKRDGVLPDWSRCTLRRLVYLAINQI